MAARINIFNIGSGLKSSTSKSAPPVTAAYGEGGNAAVHSVVVDLLWEVGLVLVLSAAAAHGGGAKSVATVLMIGIALAWAFNTFG